ncbi:MAG: FIST C-terminal domain-containing protein, partial [Bacteroidota bacterium]
EISKGFPFGIFREGQEDVVRDPIAVDPDGALVCVGKVARNTSLNILKGENVKLIDSAKEAALTAITEKSRDLLVCDCVSRILYLEDDFRKELLAVKESVNRFHENLEIEGILSIGEISSGINGYLEFYNKTIVVSTFY